MIVMGRRWSTKCRSHPLAGRPWSRAFWREEACKE